MPARHLTRDAKEKPLSRRQTVSSSRTKVPGKAEDLVKKENVEGNTNVSSFRRITRSVAAAMSASTCASASPDVLSNAKVSKHKIVTAANEFQPPDCSHRRRCYRTKQRSVLDMDRDSNKSLTFSSKPTATSATGNVTLDKVKNGNDAAQQAESTMSRDSRKAKNKISEHFHAKLPTLLAPAGSTCDECSDETDSAVLSSKKKDTVAPWDAVARLASQRPQSEACNDNDSVCTSDSDGAPYRLLGRTRFSGVCRGRRLRRPGMDEVESHSSPSPARPRRRGTSKRKTKNKKVVEWVDNTVDEDMELLDLVTTSTFPLEEIRGVALSNNANTSALCSESHTTTTTEHLENAVETSKLKVSTTVCKPVVNNEQQLLLPTPEALETVASENNTISVSTADLTASVECARNQEAETLTCDSIRQFYPCMPFTEAPSPESFRMSTTLKLPSAYAELIQLYSILEQVIAQRRRRGDPLLFNTTLLHSGSVSLQEHTETLGGRRFTLQHLRQMAWIAPHLITLSWAPVHNGVPLQSPCGTPGTPIRNGWDLEVQQRNFHSAGPVIITVLKQSAIHLRVKAFRFSCVRWLLLRHDEFLKTSDPPLVPIPLDRLCQWHPKFDIERDFIPIPLVSLPPRVQAVQHQISPLSDKRLGNTCHASPMTPRLNPHVQLRGACAPATPMRRQFSPANASPLTPSARPFTNLGSLVYLTPLRLGTSPALKSERFVGGSCASTDDKDNQPVTPGTPRQKERVHHVQTTPRTGRQDDPDDHHHSTTPSRSLTPLRFATPVRYTSSVPGPSTNVSLSVDTLDCTPTRNAGATQEAPLHTRSSPCALSAGARTTSVRTPFRSRTPPPSAYDHRSDVCPRKQWLLQKAEEQRQLHDLELMLQKDLESLQTCVRDAEDTVACLEGLAKFFFRAGSVPLAKLDCLAAKVTLIVKAKHPDMNKERTLAAIHRVAEKTKDIIMLRESKCNPREKLVQFYERAPVDREKEKLVKELNAIQSATQKLKEERLKKEFVLPLHTKQLSIQTPSAILSPFPKFE